MPLEGVRITGKDLEPLRPVLEQWLRSIRDYVRRTREWNPKNEPDYPYFYNERATLSSLAAAAWLSGGVALEECSAPKQGKSGRADLWLLLDDKAAFAIEAKQLWIGIGTRAHPSTSEETVKEALAAAKKDALKLPKSWGYPLGIIFVVPQAPKSDEEQIGHLVHGFLRRAIHPRIQGAWWFDSDVGEADDGYLYPGVLLIVESP